MPYMKVPHDISAENQTHYIGYVKQQTNVMFIGYRSRFREACHVSANTPAQNHPEL